MMKETNKASLIAFQEYLIHQGAMSNLEFHEPAKAGEIKRLEKHLGLPPAQEAIDFYTQGLGYAHTWMLLGQNGMAGRTVFFDLKTALTIATAPEEYQLEPLQYLWEEGYLILEGNVIDKFFTLLKISETRCTLFLFLNQKKLVPLEVTISDYVQFSLAAGGLFQWQLYISESATSILERLSYDGFFTALEKLKGGLPPGNFVNTFAGQQEMPDTANYHERIEKAFSLQQNAPAILSKKVRPGESKAVIRRAELALGCRLPGDYLRFYREVGGLEIHWKGKQAGEYANFKLLTVGETFGGPLFSSTIFWKNNVGSFLNMHEEIAGKLEGYYPLVVEEAGTTLIREEQGKFILYFMMEFEPVRLAIGFSQYIDKLLMARGLAYWQLLFLEHPYSEGNPLLEPVINGIQTYFPDVSLEEFRQKA